MKTAAFGNIEYDFPTNSSYAALGLDSYVVIAFRVLHYPVISLASFDCCSKSFKVRT